MLGPVSRSLADAAGFHWRVSRWPHEGCSCVRAAFVGAGDAAGSLSCLCILLFSWFGSAEGQIIAERQLEGGGLRILREKEDFAFRKCRSGVTYVSLMCHLCVANLSQMCPKCVAHRS